MKDNIYLNVSLNLFKNLYRCLNHFDWFWFTYRAVRLPQVKQAYMPAFRTAYAFIYWLLADRACLHEV